MKPLTILIVQRAARTIGLVCGDVQALTYAIREIRAGRERKSPRRTKRVTKNEYGATGKA